MLFQVRNCSRWSEAAPFNTHSYAAVRLTMAPEAYICFIRGGRGWSGDSQYRQIQAIKSNSKGMIYVNVKCAERGRGAARNSPHAQSPFCRFSPRKRKGTQRAPLATRNNLAKGPSSRSIGRSIVYSDLYPLLSSVATVAYQRPASIHRVSLSRQIRKLKLKKKERAGTHGPYTALCLGNLGVSSSPP